MPCLEGAEVSNHHPASARFVGTHVGWAQKKNLEEVPAFDLQSYQDSNNVVLATLLSLPFLADLDRIPMDAYTSPRDSLRPLLYAGEPAEPHTDRGENSLRQPQVISRQNI